MLNSDEHEISTAHKYRNSPYYLQVLRQDNQSQKLILLKMLKCQHTIVGILTFTQVVIRGTSSKKSQRNFVPSTHPGTHELALSGRKLSTKVCLSAFINIHFFMSDLLKNPTMQCCLEIIYLLSKPGLIVDICTVRTQF